MRANFARAWSMTRALGVARLGGEADDERPAAAPGVARSSTRPRTMSGFSTSSTRRPAAGVARLLDLAVADADAAGSRRGRGHDDDVGAVGGLLAPPTAARGSSRRARRRTPSGTGSDTLAATRVTFGPALGRRARDGHALLAGRAVAEVAHRVERLAGAAGGDDDAAALEVADGCLRRSAERHPRRSRGTRHTAASGSGRRPAPVSLPVRRPTAGSMTCAPRERSVATLAWVAGCSHISVCMAGANATGHRAVSRVLVSRSSARPWAAFARRSAVAGATTTRSADCPMRTCGTSCTEVHTSVLTGLPDRADHVGAPDEVRAPPRWARR